METKIQCGSKTLNAYVVIEPESKHCILFIYGGALTIGKERYYEWQKNLKTKGVSSVSFDYSGIHGSGDLLKKTSIESRIDETLCVAEWMKINIPVKNYTLYGVSMGGYIALATAMKTSSIFNKLILHAPAAYSSNATPLTFGKKFTEEIRKKDSWQDSYSFKWINEFNKPILFIEAENDEIIPKQITDTYRSIKSNADNFETLTLKASPHGIWKNETTDIDFRNKIYDKIITWLSI